MIVKLVLMLLCIVFSAYFSATETAFSSLNKTKLKAMAEKGSKKAASTLKTAENYDKLLSTILIGNNIVNIALASMGTLLFVDLIGESGATVSTIVITVVVLIFGEITPKSIAKDHPESFALFSAPIIRVFIKILTPLNFVFSAWKKLVSKLFKSKDSDKMSQEELLMLLDEGADEGALDNDEMEYIRNVLKLDDLTAESVMTPRKEIVSLSVDSTDEEIMKTIVYEGYSRIPVEEDGIDRIVGILHARDYLIQKGAPEFDLKSILHEATFVPETVDLDTLFKNMQHTHTHMVIAVNEYGETSGIVTMEDIIEELVGEIWDERDEEIHDFVPLSGGGCKVLTGVSVEDFREYFKLKDEIETESATVNGWLVETAERIPKKGDRFEYKDLLIVVTDADAFKTNEIVVKRLKKTKEDK